MTSQLADMSVASEPNQLGLGSSDHCDQQNPWTKVQARCRPVEKTDHSSHPVAGNCDKPDHQVGKPGAPTAKVAPENPKYYSAVKRSILSYKHGIASPSQKATESQESALDDSESDYVMAVSAALENMNLDCNIDMKSLRRTSYKSDSHRRNVKETARRSRKKRRMKIKPHASGPEMHYTASADSKPGQPMNLGKMLLSLQKLKETQVPEIMESLKDLADNQETPDADEYLNYLENILILAYQAYNANNLMDVVVAFLGYCKRNSTKSMIREVMNLVSEVNSDDFQTQDESVIPHGEEMGLMQYYELLKTNPILSKISYLMTAAMSIAGCEMTGETWTHNNFKMVLFEAQKQQYKCTDIIDAMVSTFAWMCETGVRCFREKSLYPILYANQESQQKMEILDDVLAKAPSVLNGNGEDVGQFEVKVQDSIRFVAKLKAARANGNTALWLQNRYEELVTILEAIHCKRKNTMIRFQPYGIAVKGHSSVGKSTLAKYLMKIGLASCGFDFDPSRIVSLDPNDEYQSTYTSDVLAVYLDDLGNVKAEFAKTAPSELIIKFFNNMAAQAIKAELNAKGVCYLDFKVGIVTSNHKDLGVGAYTEVPSACLRRFIHLNVRVKEEYCLPGSPSLDTSKVPLPRDDKEIVDIWKIDFELAIPRVNKNDKMYTHWEPAYYEALNEDGEKTSYLAKDLNLKEALDAIAYFGKRHKATQEVVVEGSKRIDQLKVCKQCCTFETYCRCAILDKAFAPSDSSSDDGSHGSIWSSDSTVSSIQRESHECDELEKQYHLAAVEAAAVARRKIGRRRVAQLTAYNDDESDALSEFSSGEWPYFGTRDEEKSVEHIPEERPDSVQPHSMNYLGDVVANSVKRGVESYVQSWLRPFTISNWLLGYSPIREKTTASLARSVASTLHTEATPWLVALAPNFIYESQLFQKYMSKMHSHTAAYDMAGWRNAVFVTGSLMCGISLSKRSFLGTVASTSVTIASYSVLHAQHVRRLRMIRAEYFARRDALPEQVKVVRDSMALKGGIAVISIIACIKIFRYWNSERLATEPHSEESHPGWFGFLMHKIGFNVEANEEVKTATASQVAKTSKKNCFWCEVTLANGASTRCNIVFMQKGIALLPRHVFYPDFNVNNVPVRHISVVVYRHSGIGGIFKFTSSYGLSHVFADLDMVMLSVPNCPDLPTLEKWLPKERPTGNAMCQFLMRDKGEEKSERVHVTFGMNGHDHMDFYGGSYKSELSSVGKCMGLIISEQAAPCIVGFHIGGNAAKKYGVMQTLTLPEYHSALETYRATDGVLVMAKSDIIPHCQYGKPIVVGPTHPKSYALEQTTEAGLEVFGSSMKRSPFSSKVTKSMLSDSVEKHMDCKNIWGPPKMKPNWRAYNATFDHMVNPSSFFVPTLLEKARQDWLCPLFAEIDKGVSISPLTDKESYMGIDGKRFITPINMKTSCGFPVFGAKSKLVDEIRDGETLIDRIPKDELRREIARMREAYRNKQRAYPVVSATLKDEPTPINKDKVRVFQNSPIAFTILLRKYFLPIVRFLGLNPLLSESAVGVNSFSKEWEVLMEHAEKYAPDGKVTAWDYKKYDVRMNSQITTAAWLCLIDLAERAGYSNDDLNIMRTMVTDVVHPLMDFNGTILMLFSIQISGQPITVQINGIVGSLYVRMGFFHLCQGMGDFRENVSALTYGDDYKGSVKEECRSRFNFRTFQEFMEAHDVQVTLPDKSDDVLDFMDSADADFLKRSSQYIPEIDTTIGKLDEMSIFRPLHANVVSKKSSELEIATASVQTALHEWFAHGREVYEKRRSQLQGVCDECNLPVSALEISFDDRVSHWLSKYQK